MLKWVWPFFSLSLPVERQNICRTVFPSCIEDNALGCFFPAVWSKADRQSSDCKEQTLCSPHCWNTSCTPCVPVLFTSAVCHRHHHSIYWQPHCARSASICEAGRGKSIRQRHLWSRIEFYDSLNAWSCSKDTCEPLQVHLSKRLPAPSLKNYLIGHHTLLVRRAWSKSLHRWHTWCSPDTRVWGNFAIVCE